MAGVWYLNVREISDDKVHPPRSFASGKSKANLRRFGQIERQNRDHK